MSEDFTNRVLGLVPSRHDSRDYQITKFVTISDTFPDSYIIPCLPDIYDQGSYPMCVAFAVSGTKESQEYLERGTKFRYSPMYIYGNRKEGDYMGEGMCIAEALANLRTDGVVPYTDLPGLASFTECYEKVKSKADYYAQRAKPQKVLNYVRLNSNADEIKTALTKLGTVVLGIAVYNSFYNVGSNGIVSDIQSGEEIKGYHAMQLVGWKRIGSKYYWIVINSWGKRWGKDGICFIPFDYKGIFELWSVTDLNPANERTIEMRLPMQILPEGVTVLPFREIYEAIGGSVEWGWIDEAKSKIWVRATIPATKRDMVIFSEQGSNKLLIS